MHAVFDSEGHTITDEQIRLGKLFANDYFGELGVLVEEWPGIPFQRNRSARIVSKVAMLFMLTYRDLQNLCQSSYQINNRVQRHIAQLKKNQPSMFPSKALPVSVKQMESVVDAPTRESSTQLDALSNKVDGIERDITEIKQMLLTVLKTEHE